MMSIVQFLEERYAMIDPSVQGIFDECPGAKACEQSEPASPSESAGLRGRAYSFALAGCCKTISTPRMACDSVELKSRGDLPRADGMIGRKVFSPTFD
jgi:hypothetical protein